jgi:UPF0716 protein FxsA
MAPAGRLEGPHEPGGEGGRRRPGGSRRARGGTARPRRAPRRARWLLATLLLVPLVEIIVVIAVGQQVGPWWTLAGLVALTLVGAWLVRREGARTWRRLQDAVRSGQTPARELSDAGLVLVGGVLLLTPGFVTGVIGLLLVLPFTRPLTRGWVERLVASRLLLSTSGMSWSAASGPWRPPGGGEVIEGEIVEEEPGPDERGPAPHG